MYTRAFVEIYNWRYRKLVHKTHRIVKPEKYLILRAKNSLYLGSQQFYKIFELLQSTHIMLSNNESNISYLKNCIE